MATNLRSFARNLGSDNAAEPEARIPADVWMNVGYTAVDKDDEGNEIEVFVGTPLGIALDTQQPIDTSKTRSPKLLKVQTYQNKLLSDLQEEIKTLEPGETRIVQLEVQILRKKAPGVAPATTESDVLARKAPLFAPAQPAPEAAAKTK